SVSVVSAIIIIALSVFSLLSLSSPPARVLRQREEARQQHAPPRHGPPHHGQRPEEEAQERRKVEASAGAAGGGRGSQPPGRRGDHGAHQGRDGLRVRQARAVREEEPAPRGGARLGGWRRRRWRPGEAEAEELCVNPRNIICTHKVRVGSVPIKPNPTTYGNSRWVRGARRRMSGVGTLPHRFFPEGGSVCALVNRRPFRRGAEKID
ncbi:unnamed protein product, partial [Ectocarpus fasciculatus]